MHSVTGMKIGKSCFKVLIEDVDQSFVFRFYDDIHSRKRKLLFVYWRLLKRALCKLSRKAIVTALYG